MASRLTGTQRATDTQRSSATTRTNTSRFTKPRLRTSSARHPVLQLHPTIGNRAVLRLVESNILQAKARIDQEELVQARPAGPVGQSSKVTPDIETRVNALRGAGQPLPESVRAFFEPRFGYDFSDVRIHTDPLAAESAVAVNARSYTVGHDVVFDAGQYAPGTEAGKRLLAHELSHVMQQNSFQTSLLSAHNLQRKPVFKKCEGKEETLSSAIDEAKKSASRALLALKGERLESIEKEHVQTALRNNFGDVTAKQKTTITDRYANIHDTLDSKEITCIDKKKKDKKTTICAEAHVGRNKIALYLDFWQDVCGSKGEMILHEAAHNAGAKNDIHKDEGYPPKKNAEDNSYSYQYFAADVKEGPRIRYKVPKVREK